MEESQSVSATEATPANGELPAQPAARGRAASGSRGSSSSARAAGWRCRSDLQGRLAARRRARADSDYVRATAEGRWLTGAGAGTSSFTRVYAGAGTDGLPAYRSFVLGGRGTLMREPFRAYGGRAMALAPGGVAVRGRRCRPFRLGSFACTGRRMTLAPFLAAGCGRPPARRAPLGRQRRRAAGRRGGARVVHAPHPGRGRCRTAGLASSGSRLMSIGTGGACCRPCADRCPEQRT